MKRFLIFFGLIAAVCGQVLAQDTLLMSTPPNNYFYDNWPTDDSVRLNALGFNVNFSPETALRFYTKDSLQVYGIAVMLRLSREYEPNQWIDTTLDSIYGYAKLYEAEIDSPRTIGQAKVHFRDTPISYYMAINKYDGMSVDTWPSIHLLEPLAVQEVFFDAPITVADSFYVGFRFDRHYRLDVTTYNTKYKLALRCLMPNHLNWENNNSFQTVTYYTDLDQWRYEHRGWTWMYLLFPVLTPDTVNHPQDTTIHGGDSLTVEPVWPFDRLVSVQPNPATEQVRVLSSFGLTHLTAYDAAGVKVYDQAVSGLKATLEVTGWPAGTYILHIQTPVGVSTKRLVVAR